MDKSTVWNWEKGHTSPPLYTIPKVIEFLGYAPWNGLASTLGEKIVRARRWAGLTQETLARQIGVDPTTLARWEGGDKHPSKRSMEIIDRFWLRAIQQAG